MATPAPAAAAPPAGAVPVAVPPPAALGGAQPQQQQVVYYVYQMGSTPGAASGQSQAIDWTVCFSFYFLRTALNFLNIASWVIYIAGTSKAQSNCNGGLYDPPNTYPVPPLQWQLQPNNSYDLSTGDCVTIYGLLWWSVWLQFISVVTATVTSFAMFSHKSWVRAVFTPTMYFFIMSSVLLFFTADSSNQQTWILNKRGNDNLNAHNQWLSATTLTLVGAVASLICNFLWIVWNSFGDIPDAAKAPVPAAAPAPHVDGDAFVVPPDTKAPAQQAAPTTSVTVGPSSA